MGLNISPKYPKRLMVATENDMKPSDPQKPHKDGKSPK